jgi:hypothetical protein
LTYLDCLYTGTTAGVPHLASSGAAVDDGMEVRSESLDRSSRVLNKQFR